MSVADRKAVEALVKLGFKEYQAKVYCALVALGQASASEVYKGSGVPRPRVYDTLDELVKIGVVNFRQGRPVVYKAVEPTKVVEWSRKTYLAAGDEAISQLEKLSVQQTPTGNELVWVLRGEENIQSKMKQMINESRKEIFVRFFDPQTYLQLRSQLEEARARRVHIKSLVFGQEEKTLLDKIGDLARTIDFRKEAPDTNDKTGIMSLIMESIPADSFSWGSLTGLVIADMKQSFVTFEDSTRSHKSAVWFGVPVVVGIQRVLFEYMWRNGENTKKL
jgi:sugar-specific transcriptional regulator TrmB